jgi:hypothetical protein
MTYGDVISPRSGLLDRIRENDWVAFYGLLTPIKTKRSVTKERKFFIVSAFEVKKLIRELPQINGNPEIRRRFILDRFGQTLGRRILENAHTRRWLQSPRLNDRMRMIIIGGPRSKRFVKPLSLTRAVCESCFKAENGKPWKWDKSKSELQTIGSYLRSVRRATTPANLIDLSLDPERVGRPNLYSYIVAHDTGFAPCVTNKLLTLACCKPEFGPRQSSVIGSWAQHRKNTAPVNWFFSPRLIKESLSVNTMRAGSSFLPVPHAVLAGMFGRRRQATIFNTYASAPARAVKDLDGQMTIEVKIGFQIHNKGPVLARDLYSDFRLFLPKPKCEASFELLKVKPKATSL